MEIGSFNYATVGSSTEPICLNTNNQTMKQLFGTLVLVIVTALPAAALTEENIHETRAAKPGGKLIVDVDFGSISVAPGDNDKVVVDAHRAIEAHSKDKEKEYLASAPIVVTTDEKGVTIRARRKESWSFWSWFGHTRTDANYTIQVPANFDSDLQ